MCGIHFDKIYPSRTVTPFMDNRVSLDPGITCRFFGQYIDEMEAIIGLMMRSCSAMLSFYLHAENNNSVHESMHSM
jgi:hypothetical protein